MSALSRNVWDTVSSPGVVFSAGGVTNNLTAVTFSNSNGVSFGLNAGVITASAVGGGGSLNISAGTTSSNVSAVTFSNANGVSWGFDGTNVSATVATNYAGTGFTSATTAGTAIVGTLNSNGVSLGVPAYLTTYVNDLTSGRAGTGFTSATTAGTNIVGTLNTNGLSVGVPAFITTYVNDLTSGRAGTGFTSATTAGTNVVGTLNTNGLSLGVPAYITTYANDLTSGRAGTGFTSATTSGTAVVGTLDTNGLSVGIPAFITTAAGAFAISNSQTLFSTGTVALSEGGGAITIASSAGGQSLMFSVPQTSSLVGVSGIGISTSGSTISIYQSPTVETMSYWSNLQEFQGTTTTMCQSNSFYVLPLLIQNNLSVSYLRLIASFDFTSTSIATSAVNNASGASSAFSETNAFNAVLYTVGTGASSRSLQYYFSTSVGLTWAVSISQASTSNATNQSHTQRITYPSEGFSTATFSTQYSVSATNCPVSTTQLTNLNGGRYLDIPFATSLSAGNYWLALNRISGTVGGKNLDCNASSYGVSNMNLTFGAMNVATNLSNAAPYYGLGLWTTNAAQTTSSMGFGSISVTTSYAVPFVQFIRQA